MSTKPEKAEIEARQDLPRVRVSKVTIEGFKAFKDPFTLEIPPPLAQDDMDVFVLGSVNGVGKTTVLEGVLLAVVRAAANRLGNAPWGGVLKIIGKDALLARIVNAANGEARLECAFHTGEWSFILSVSLGESGVARSVRAGPGVPNTVRWAESVSVSHEAVITAMAAILGYQDDPVIAPPVLYFHSFRKVSPANVNLQAVSELAPAAAEQTRVINRFKWAALRAVLGQQEVLEVGRHGQDTDVQIDVLARLLGTFADAHLGKLRADGDSLEVRVRIGPHQVSTPIDALSSGQKEIISTLFLIWEATRECPSVVLIDEPELHLHPEWHSTAVRMLWELAPWNQYIVATHSGEVARSVEPDRVFIIEP